MKYFAYGSNMFCARLKAKNRVPSAQKIGVYTLTKHDLRFHKKSNGSAKCDAYQTGNEKDFILGVLFDISSAEKEDLDKAEGLGHGYDQKTVSVLNDCGEICEAVTYFATNIDASLKPYSWYKKHVVTGAREADLAEEYVKKKIDVIVSVEDPCKERESEELAIYGNKVPK